MAKIVRMKSVPHRRAEDFERRLRSTYGADIKIEAELEDGIVYYLSITKADGEIVYL